MRWYRVEPLRRQHRRGPVTWEITVWVGLCETAACRLITPEAGQAGHHDASAKSLPPGGAPTLAFNMIIVSEPSAEATPPARTSRYTPVRLRS
jgi:hypothetical protein